MPAASHYSMGDDSHRFLARGRSEAMAYYDNVGSSVNSGISVFQSCSEEVVGQQTQDSMALIMECVSNKLEARQVLDDLDKISWLLVIAGSMIFFMQTGFAMLCAGCVRRKNVQNTMLKNLLDACGAALAFYVVGYAFAFGDDEDSITQKYTFIGTKNFFSRGNIDKAFWFFEYAFSATAVTIVAGTLAERCQMSAYLCYSIFLTGFVYPVVVHTVWGSYGFLSAFAEEPINGIGTIDFAGSGVVHVTGGTTALMATYILGARRGRFVDSRGRPLAVPKPMPGHSMALQLMGTMVLWFGWYGFNAGSALLLTTTTQTGTVAATAALNTSLSAGTGAIVCLFTHIFREERRTGEFNFDLTKAMNGALSGLVAITAGCGTVEPYGAITTGAVAAWIYMASSEWLVWVRLDDAVDAIPVHLFNGSWGLIAAGLFSSKDLIKAAYGTDEHVGLFYSEGDFTLLGNQLLTLVFVFGWAAFTMLPFFVWLNYLGWFRADSLEEMVGLDISYHGSGGHVTDEDDHADHVKAFQERRQSKQMNRRSKRLGDASCDDRMDPDDESWAEMSTSPTLRERSERGETFGDSMSVDDQSRPDTEC